MGETSNNQGQTLEKRPEKKKGLFLAGAALFRKIEDSILVGLLLIMIGLAVLQIFLRNVMDSGIVWGDSLVRVLVLWIGLMGAMVASRNHNHISIDIISRYLPRGLKRFTNLGTNLFTTLITALMAWFSLGFVRMEMADNYKAFASVPAWVCEIIIPLAFFIMSLRYLFFCISQVVRIFSKERS